MTFAFVLFLLRHCAVLLRQHDLFDLFLRTVTAREASKKVNANDFFRAKEIKYWIENSKNKEKCCRPMDSEIPAPDTIIKAFQY